MLHTVCHANAVHVTADNFNLKIRTTHTNTHTNTRTHTQLHLTSQSDQMPITWIQRERTESKN